MIFSHFINCEYSAQNKGCWSGNQTKQIWQDHWQGWLQTAKGSRFVYNLVILPSTDNAHGPALSKALIVYAVKQSFAGNLSSVCVEDIYGSFGSLGSMLDGL